MLAILNKIGEIIARWWSDFTLQTRLMAGATLVVSLIMSGLTFWAVNTIQQDARLNDTRYGRDLGLLLAANVAPLIAKNDRSEVARFSRQFYSSTSSVRYMLYADEAGDIFLGIPFSESEVQTSLTLRRQIKLPDNFLADIEARNLTSLPLVRQHLTPDGEVTDVFVPLIHEDKYLGVLAIGINPNPAAVISSNLTRDVTLAVFVTIWVMVILGAVFNALTITQPIKQLVFGVKNIASGNFKQRVDLPLGGELGELIGSFNEMAQKLESYEEQNIEELTAEKAKLETLVSTIADGALLLDANLQVILVNPTGKRIFGWEGKNALGSQCSEHFTCRSSAGVGQTPAPNSGGRSRRRRISHLDERTSQPYNSDCFNYCHSAQSARCRTPVQKLRPPRGRYLYRAPTPGSCRVYFLRANLQASRFRTLPGKSQRHCNDSAGHHSRS
jgi:two-component system sensor histidine kinase NblS